MNRSRRSTFLAALVLVAAAPSAAQTVVVTRAPAGSTVELMVNATAAASTSADMRGHATLIATLQDLIGKNEIDARVFVDACGEARRILLVDRAASEPPPGGACTRHVIEGLYLVRDTTSLLVDLGGPRPTLWIRQGPVPREWLLTPEEQQERAARARVTPPTGLVLFGGGGVASYARTGTVFCGDVAGCRTRTARLAYTAGVAYWLAPFIAAEASYTRPGSLTAAAQESDYRFESTLDPRVIAIVGKLGGPAGRVRIFGQGGLTYHRAISTTHQTIDDRTTTLGEEILTVPGGSQTFQWETAGWSWLVGGGLEIWLTRHVALYADATRALLKGRATSPGEARLDERLFSLVVTTRVRLGR